MGFPRQENWSGLLFPPPEDLPNPGTKPSSPELAGEFFTTATREAWILDLCQGKLPLSFQGDSDGKESACNVGDLGSIPGLGRSPGGGNGNPLQYSCLENSHGQRSLAGYSPWGCKELGKTD